MSGTWLTGWVTGNVVTAAEYKKGVGMIFDSTAGGAVASIDTGALGVPAGYNALMIVTQLRGDTVATAVAVNARFNADSTTSYSWQNSVSTNATTTATEGIGVNLARIGRCPAASAPASEFSSTRAEIANYASANHKNGTAQTSSRENTTSGTMVLETNSFSWFATGAAITRVQILPSTGNFVAGSRVTIYVMGF